MKSRFLSILLFLLCTVLGLFSVLYPFLLPALTQSPDGFNLRSGEMPWMLSGLILLCLVVLLYEAQSDGLNPRTIALLGMLVAINASLRFLETAVPGPGGFTPIFFLILLAGYIYGARFGFLMGALTLLVSALITGGVGPWLPSQMFVAGWMGMSAPICRLLVKKFHLGTKGEIACLTLFATLWGFGYGLLINLWGYPFLMGPANAYWSPGISLWETIRRYLVYYSLTSLVWDIGGAAGNLLMMTAFGIPALAALRRFQKRFHFQFYPAPASIQKQESSL